MNPSASPLPEHLAPFIARLGVFHGGAQETLLLAITGLAQIGPKGDLATGVRRDTWPELRASLLARGWITEHELPGSARPFLAFRSEFAKADWNALGEDQRGQLLRRHQRHYFQFIGQLSKLTATHSDEAEQLVARELDNLLAACQGAIDAREEWALEFVERLGPFLDRAERHEANQGLHEQLAIHYSRPGSPAWLRERGNDAERLVQAGEFKAARDILSAMIHALADEDRFGLMANLARRAHCSRELGDIDEALRDYQDALATSEYVSAGTARAETRLRIQLDLASLLAANGDARASMDYGQRALREAEALQNWQAMAEIARIQTDIASRLGDTRKAQAYRQLTRLALACTDEGRERIASQRDFIVAAADAIDTPQAAEHMQALLREGEQAGWSQGATAVRAIIDGSRDEDALCDALDMQDQVLIHAILQEIAHREKASTAD